MFWEFLVSCDQVVVCRRDFELRFWYPILKTHLSNTVSRPLSRLVPASCPYELPPPAHEESRDSDRGKVLGVIAWRDMFRGIDLLAVLIRTSSISAWRHTTTPTVPGWRRATSLTRLVPPLTRPRVRSVCCPTSCENCAFLLERPQVND